MSEVSAHRLLLTPAQAADELGVGRSTLYELIASGDIPSVVVGRRRRIPMEELKSWIKRRITSAGANVAEAKD